MKTIFFKKCITFRKFEIFENMKNPETQLVELTETVYSIISMNILDAPVALNVEIRNFRKFDKSRNVIFRAKLGNLSIHTLVYHRSKH